MTYCLVQNGAITRYSVSKPTANNVSFGKTTTDAEYAEHGWYKVIDNRPVQTAYNRVSGPIGADAIIDHDAKTVTYVYTVTPKSLDDVKAERLAALAAKRYDVEVGGTMLNGSYVPTERSARADLVGARISALEDVNFTLDWKTPDGFVTLTAAQIVAIADASRNHVKATFAHEKTLTQAINSATTVDDVLAIDIESGW